MNTPELAFTIRQILRYPLIIALLAQVSAQAFKVVLYSLTERRFAWDRFFFFGGVTSGHTAFVTGAAAAFGLQRGVTSDVFAVAVVFGAIVVYDAMRLRGIIQRHAEVLNLLLAPRQDAGLSSEKPLPEHIGHSAFEIVAGIAWGIAWAVALTFW